MTAAWSLMDVLNKKVNKKKIFPLLFSALLLAGCSQKWSLATSSLAHACTCPAVKDWNPVFMDFVSRVQPEGSHSQNSVLKIFADIFQNVQSTPHKVLSITQEMRFLVLRQPLNSTSWRRIQGELPWRWGFRWGGVMISAIPEIGAPLRKRRSLKFNYLRRVTHQVLVQYNTWIQWDMRQNETLDR